jgi:hypothetical protein
MVRRVYSTFRTICCGHSISFFNFCCPNLPLDVCLDGNGMQSTEIIMSMTLLSLKSSAQNVCNPTPLTSTIFGGGGGGYHAYLRSTIGVIYKTPRGEYTRAYCFPVEYQHFESASTSFRIQWSEFEPNVYPPLPTPPFAPPLVTNITR